MRAVRTRLKLGVELTGHKEWMISGFDHLYQMPIRAGADGADAPRLVLIAVVIVTLVAVTVTLDDLVLAIGFVRLTALCDHTWIITEAHSAAGVFFTALVVHGVDDDVLGLGIKL